jgi:hypothetical protein
MTIQALTYDDLENIVDQVMEVTKEDFERAMQKKEEMHLDVQVKIYALRHILETTRIMPVRIGE